MESGFSCTRVSTSGPTYSSRPSPSCEEEALIWRARLAAMITSRYLLSTTPSSSSIGGLMMPSAPWVTATCASSLIVGDQRYHLPAALIDGCVHQQYVELACRGELISRRGQAALHDV